MRRARHWSERGYAVAIRLYPPAFRAEFEEEMQAVFAEALAEAGRPAGVTALWVRELRDLPQSLLRAHWHAHREGRPPQASRPYSFARWGALGFGVGFGLVESMPSILAPALQVHRGLAPWLGTILYLSVGALSGALLGVASRSRRTVLSFALTGSLAFALAAWAAYYVAMRLTPGGGLVTLLIAQPMLIGALASGLVGAAQRRWKQAARLAIAGALVFGLGRIGGAMLELVPWAAAQAVASYQAAPANAWLAAVPFYLAVFASGVTGIVGGAYLGLSVGRSQIVANR